MKAATKTQAEALNKLILSDPLIQEFKKYEEALKQHPELLALEAEIKEDSQIILKKKALGELTEEEMKAYSKKKEYFENHPLITYFKICMDVRNRNPLEACADKLYILFRRGIPEVLAGICTVYNDG